MERHFPMKLGQPIGMALATACFSSKFPNYGKEPVCQKWNDEFRLEYSNQNKWTTSRDDPKYSGAFHYAKDSGNFGWNSNGKVHFGFFRPEYSGSPLEVVHLFRLEYSERNWLFHF